MAKHAPESGIAAADPTPSDLPAELVAGLKRMGEMLGNGDVEGARAWVKELEMRWPESERVRHYARVLAPPTVRTVPRRGGRGFAKEHAWLKAHAREYPGCWIAVLEDQLIAADPDLRRVLAAARGTSDPMHTLIHFQPRSEA